MDLFAGMRRPRDTTRHIFQYLCVDVSEIAGDEEEEETIKGGKIGKETVLPCESYNLEHCYKYLTSC